MYIHSARVSVSVRLRSVVHLLPREQVLAPRELRARHRDPDEPIPRSRDDLRTHDFSYTQRQTPRRDRTLHGIIDIAVLYIHYNICVYTVYRRIMVWWGIPYRVRTA